MIIPNSIKYWTKHLHITLVLLIVVMVSSGVALFPKASMLIVTISLLLLVFLIIRNIQFDLLLWACLFAYTFVQWIPALESIRFVLLFFLIAYSGYSSKGHKLGFNAVATGLGLVALYSIITSLQSYYPIVALFKGLSLLLLAGFLSLAPSAIHSLYSSQSIHNHILHVYVYFAIIVVVSSAIYYFIMPTSSNEYFSGTSFLNGRFRGWFVNPNDFATLLGVFFIPILWFECRRRKRGLLKTLIMIIFILTLLELILTQSRSGVLAGAISLSIAILANKKWGTRIVIIIGILFSLALIYFQNPGENFLRKFAYRNEINLEGSGRLLYWSAAWNRFLGRPILGSGLGVSNSGVEHEGIVFSTLEFKQQIDNSYLSALEELGVLGFLLLVVSLLVPLWIKCWGVFKLTNNVILGFQPVFVAIVVAGLFNVVFEAWLLSVGSLLGFSFWVFAACLIMSNNRGISGAALKETVKVA